MGFWKVVGCIAGGVAAVVAAPVVLPAAAAVAAGAAAAGGAVAAGAAAAGGAIAAGAAAAGGAVAAGAAAAGGAVAAAGGAVVTGAAAAGSVALGTAATVGTAVGVAAEAVGIGAVAAAAGTTAGAAAVGTIAVSSAVSLQQGIKAINTMNELKEKGNYIKRKYDSASKAYNEKYKNFEKTAEALAQSKKNMAECLETCTEYFKILKNTSKLDKIEYRGTNVKGVETDIDMEFQAIKIQDWAKGIVGSYAGGYLVSMAISSSVTTAGTGTAISALSGIAAENAVLASLGGGTLASGGLGVAGGAVISSGLMMAPALAIGTVLTNVKLSKAKEDLYKVASKASDCMNKMEKAKPYLDKYVSLMQEMDKNIKEMVASFNKLNKEVAHFINVENKVDVASWSTKEFCLFMGLCTLSKIMEVQGKQEFIKVKDGEKPKEYDMNHFINKDELITPANSEVYIGDTPAIVKLKEAGVA